MEFATPAPRRDGGWSVEIHGACTRDLVRAFDPEQAYVVVEGHSPIGTGWHQVQVQLNAEAASVADRVVRGLRFDLLLTPQTAISAAADLDGSFPLGGFYAWQTFGEPPADLRLLDMSDGARIAAIRGIGVTLLIDLPHAGETAVLWSPARKTLDAALERVR